MNKLSYLPANWSNKPENVFATTTLINGGVSKGDFSEYNLAAHVGDDPTAVEANRLQLVADLQLPSEPVWLDQVHSNKVFCADESITRNSATINPSQKLHTVQADASFTGTKGVVCAVLTADCLPVFFCNNGGTEVAVAHAGWRGLHAGIVTNTVNAMQASADEIQVSLGPAIGPQSFEVGEEVFHAFVNKNSLNKTAFAATKKGHYLCDIYQLARIELQSIGIGNISGGEYCTYSEGHRFYSYRRQQNTGRMASLIWLA